MANMYIYFSFACVALIAASMVIVAKNTVHAALFLILTFISTACIWLLLELDFLAILLILLYVGAVMVLFLFVIMMIDLKDSIVKNSFIRYLPLGLFVTVLLTIILVKSLSPGEFNAVHSLADNYSFLDQSYNSVQLLGELLYTKYLFHLEIAGILLLVAIIIAIMLCCKNKQLKQIRANKININKQDRIYLIEK